MVVSLKNDAGVVREVKVGFSWTCFFFGGLPFLFRGQASKFFLWWLISVVTLGLGIIYLWFNMNKISAVDYMERGYRPVGPGWDVAGKAWGMAPSMLESAHSASAGTETTDQVLL